MPSRERVEALIRLVEAGQFDRAIAEFYAPGATMQENLNEPRARRDRLVAYERGVMAAARSIRARCVPPVLIEGDTVVIHWIFEFDWKDGGSRRLEELAHQTWAHDQVVVERFYYDPKPAFPP